MSKFAIKGLVVPLIFFWSFLFSNPNPNPLTMHCWQTEWEVVGTSKSEPKSWLLSNIGTKTAMQVIEEVAAEIFFATEP